MESRVCDTRIQRFECAVGHTGAGFGRQHAPGPESLLTLHERPYISSVFVHPSPHVPAAAAEALHARAL